MIRIGVYPNPLGADEVETQKRVYFTLNYISSIEAANLNPSFDCYTLPCDLCRWDHIITPLGCIALPHRLAGTPFG